MILSLRNAKSEDIKLYYDWAIDPVVRDTAISSAPIVWESHKNWFYSKLQSKSILLVLMLDECPIGQIKFDLKSDGCYYLGYSIDSKYRGKGYGKKIIDLGIQYLNKKNIHITIIAQVKKSNIASIKVFEATSFQYKGEVSTHNILLKEYEFRT
ncbi:GNAT family N-acetyltransferase [Reichenbachiella sp.]|uniref:GNAT family N-acetyltransferase n=1 Tax=Reichenbachiella sp. TaxID=2184521 RepID=UPI003BAE5153